VARFLNVPNMCQNVILWLMFVGLKWTQHGNSAGIWNSAGRWFVSTPALPSGWSVREVFSEWRVEYSGYTMCLLTDQSVVCVNVNVCEFWEARKKNISKNRKTCLDTDMAKTAKIEKACHVDIQILVRIAKAESILVGY
jgi:hypothetical protein